MTLVAEPPNLADVPTGYVPPDLAALAGERAGVSADLGARYRVGGFIARGGFASVWEAFDEAGGRAVAVKRFHPQVGRGCDFFRELRAMFALEHPNVVRIVNFLEAGATRYLILELCHGGSLRAAISAARRGRGARADAGGVVPQLAGGLAAAHKLGLTHRDLKPENVLFAEAGGGRVKLADFGLASLLSREDTGELKPLTGSPAYMAPEQFCGAFGPASDVYALGLIAFELLTGDLPFTGSAEDLAYHHLRTPPAVPAGLPAPWPELLPRMLAKEPAARPTADAVAAALSRSGACPTADRASEPDPGRIPSVVSRPAAGAVTVPLGRPAGGLVGADGEFLVFGPTGFARVAADGRTLGFVELDGLTDLFPKTGGAWCVAGRTAFEWVRGDGLVRLGDLPTGATPVQVFEADGRAGAAAFDRGVLSTFDLATGARVWAREVPNGGLRPKLARLAGGEFACTDFDGSPGLRFLGANGEDLARVPLPGICWQLGPWVNGGCAARLLTGGGFHAFRVSPRGARPLPESANVAALTTAPTGLAAGASPDGAVTRWAPPRATRRLSLPPPPGAALRGVALAGSRAAVLWAAADGSSVSVVETE